jgi:dipeptidyl aminopeptidase/acylaminoacyl peptidase
MGVCAMNNYVLSLVIFITFIFSSISAQEKYFTPHDVFKLKTVEEAVISPDEDFAAFSLRVPKPFEDGIGSAYKELFVYRYESDSVTPLLTGKVNVNDLSWTKNSEYISFTAKLNGDNYSQLYLISIDGTDTIKVSDSKSSIIQYQWHPTDNKIAYIAKENKPSLEHEKLGYGIEVFEENIPDRFLYLLDVESENVSKLVSDGAVFDFNWSPDGSAIAAAITPKNLVDDSYMFKDIYIIDAETKEKSMLIDLPGKLGNFAWSKDGKHIAFISSADKNDSVDGSLFVIAVPNSKKFTEIRNYSKEFIGSVTDIHWFDNETMLFVSEEGVYTTARKQKINSQESELVIKPNLAVFSSISLSENKIAFSGETPKHPKELFTFNLAEQRLEKNTNNNEWLNEIKLATQKVIEYKASDGLSIEGLLFYPINYEEGKKYPLIVYAHGGPESTNSYGWNTRYNRWGQSAAAKGFFVFMPNYRSGSGRGNEFTMMGFADAGGREFLDVIDGIDYLASKDLIDKDRVGIGGGSYGGYFSAWAASKHTEHFAAAVSFVGVGNQLTKRNTTDIPWESYLVHWGYWVNENPMDVYDRSPVKYAENMNTPLLLLHGTKDPRVHPSQSLEMYRAFSLRGKAPVRLVWYEGEGHGNSKNTNRLDYHLRTLNWFEYYLKGDNPKDSMPSNEIEYNLEYYEQ